MFAIPRRYSHFIFAVIQSGLTCLIAAGIASLPLVTVGQFLVHWLLSWVNDVAGRCAGGPPNSICILSSDEWRVGCAAQSKCPLWVKSGHDALKLRCPL